MTQDQVPDSPQREVLPAIPDVTEKDAALDICAYVEDMVLDRPLRDGEREALTIKARFWFRAGQQSVMRLVRELSERDKARAGSQRRPEGGP